MCTAVAETLTDEAETLASERLLEIAVPELYQRNAYRVLGLPVGASTREVRKRQKRHRRAERLGVATSDRHGYLPLPEPPDEDDMQKAMHRLQDPVSQLFDEFFWFWPLEPDGEQTDEALQFMSQGRRNDAHQHWRRLEGHLQYGQVCTHNLAVVYHVTALDLEQQSLTQPLNEDQEKTRSGCWVRCFERWKRLVDDNVFWNRVRQRIREIDDPQLPPTVSQNIRDSLARVILCINARLAVRAAERHNTRLAEQHVNVMRQSQFGSELVNDVLRGALSPLRDRVRMLCRPAEPKATADPAHANQVARQLYDDVVPLLETIDMMLPPEDPTRQGAHDEVASTLLTCQVTYGNHTDDWQESSLLLEYVVPLAGSESLRERVSQNLEVCRNNHRIGTCHYCGTRQSKDDCRVEVKMHGNVRKSMTGYNTYRVRWQHTTVHVPRCPTCKANHSRIGTCVGIFMLLGAAAGAYAFTEGFWPGLGCTVGLGLVGSLLGKALGHLTVSYRIKGEMNYRSHSGVQGLLKEGWTFGETPSETAQQNAPIRND